MPDKPLTLHVMYESDDGRTPFGCSHIRLLRPLTHPALEHRVEAAFSHSPPDRTVDLVILERLWRSGLDAAGVEALLARFRELGVSYVYTLDDDLLDLNLADGDPAAPSTDQRMAIRRLARNAVGVIVSTPFLARRMAPLNPRVQVVENCLDERLFRKPDRPDARAGRSLVFGYMGTFSHLDDLLMVVAPLRRILDEYRNRVRFEIVGIAAQPRSRFSTYQYSK